MVRVKLRKGICTVTVLSHQTYDLKTLTCQELLRIIKKNFMYLIKSGCNISGLKHVLSQYLDSDRTVDYYCLNDLLTLMENKPDMTLHEVEMQPLFWSPRKRISFVQQVHETNQNPNEQRMHNAMRDIQKRKYEVLGCADWVKEIRKVECMHIIEKQFSLGKYKAQEISDLFRYMRNVFGHFSKHQTAFKSLRPIPNTLIDVFFKTFPKLLLEMVTAVRTAYGKRFDTDFLACL